MTCCLLHCVNPQLARSVRCCGAAILVAIGGIADVSSCPPAGARSLATVTSPPLWGTARGEHAALIRELGATPVDYQREDFTRVQPGGFDVVFDGIGDEGYRRSFTALKPVGLLCAYGYLAGVRRSVVCSPYVDVDCAPIFVEVVAWRQACPRLLDQREAGVTSHLVSGGPRAAVRAAGNSRHPAARRRADLLR